MQRPEFIPQIQDTSLPPQHRLTLVAQFVLVNGIVGPNDLLIPERQPAGYVFRTYIFRDLVMCLAISEREAQRNPQRAQAESAQLWQLGLNEHTGIDPRRCGVVCTLNGAVTEVVHIDDVARSERVLKEWTETPPTADEVRGVELTALRSVQ